MIYQEVLPSKGIEKAVDSFWFYKNDQESEFFKIFPDTCTDLIFDLKKESVFLSGIMTRSRDVKLESGSELVGIRFKAETFAGLSRAPMSEFKNLRTDSSQIIPELIQSAVNQLINRKLLTEKTKYLQKLILNITADVEKEEDKLIRHIAEKIRREKGRINICSLANSNYISLRQLERRFKKSVGVTLKEFSSLVRFNGAKESICRFSDKKLSKIAYEFGYFDPAHMNREFKRISGENPSFFK